MSAGFQSVAREQRRLAAIVAADVASYPWLPREETVRLRSMWPEWLGLRRGLFVVRTVKPT